MGFMDNFTTDGMVEMKHTEYYNLMREAGTERNWKRQWNGARPRELYLML